MNDPDIPMDDYEEVEEVEDDVDVDMYDCPAELTLEERTELYEEASDNLESLREMLKSCLPVSLRLPDIDTLCRGETVVEDAPRVPEQYRSRFLIQHLNTIAGKLEYTAQPDRIDIDTEINRAIWFWNCDPGHSFSYMIPNIRYNIILMAFLSALDQAGDRGNRHVNNPEIAPFWKSFLDAWFEALIPPQPFVKRMAFLDLWQDSHYELISFSNFNKKKIELALRKMKDLMPKFPHGKANAFLERCRTGNITLEQVKNRGLGMALHFVWDHISLAREFGQHVEQLAQKVASKKVKASNVERQSRGALKFEDEESFKEAMNVKRPAVDLASVDWNDKVLSGLINVDPDIDIGRKPQLGKRPQGKRQCWMPQNDAVDFLWANVDTVCELLANMTIE